VVVVSIAQGAARGWGECVPYAHYGESVAGVCAVIEALRAELEGGMDRQALLAALPAGAARNAVDCALWDLECQLRGEPVWRLAGLDEPRALVTSFTLSIDTPEASEAAARRHAARPSQKIKLGRDDDVARVAAIRRGAPQAALLVDANEGWSLEQYLARAPALAALGVGLLEQPLPPADDHALATAPRPIPLCADESFRGQPLRKLAERYDVVNLKLDKLGGLTAALQVAAEARREGLALMVGCMCATSLSLAPAMLLASEAPYVDLDAGLLLREDRPDGVHYQGSRMAPAPRLWGLPRQR
jgi:L-alanine-DL-glutamate epimerase-like enolase superfamily enzyme